MQDIYGKRYKKMMIIPLLMFIPMLFAILIMPGIQQGIDLTGGNVLIIQSQKPIVEENLLSVLKANFSLQDLRVSTITSPTGYGAWVQYSKEPVVAEAEGFIANAALTVDANEDNGAASIVSSLQALNVLGAKQDTNFGNSKLALIAAQNALASYKEAFSKKLQDTLVKELSLGDNVEFQKREISPTLGSASFSSAVLIALIGFILITVVVFIAFRQFVPSAAIIQAMIFDGLAGLVGMAILQIPLSLTTLPALLMLIGYSVDTDILLTSRVLKAKEGTPGEHATESMKTGITMTMTAIAAMVSMLVISYFYQIEVIYEISAILLFGLIGDMIATWFMNAPILIWFMEHREKKRMHKGGM
ncbi:Protein-export membrane protein SecF [uncultured archaeon]|nr:Protein-export membrane protein SecF [uncultured archaeon]